MSSQYSGRVTRDTSGMDPNSRADVLVDDIERTRDDMTATVQAIGDKLDPANLAREAREGARSAAVGKVEQMATGAQETWRDVRQGNASGLVDTITSNPLPAGMVALGLGMLLMNRGSSSKQHGDGRRYQAVPYEVPEYRSPSGTWQQGERHEPSRMDQASSRVQGAADQASSRVSGAADQAGQAVGQFADDVGQGVSQAQHEAQRFAREGQSQFQRLLDERPLVVGALAMGAGLAAGMLIPTTSQERRTIGPARDRFVQEAESMAHEGIDRAEHEMEKMEQGASSGGQGQGSQGQGKSQSQAGG